MAITIMLRHRQQQMHKKRIAEAKYVISN